jgi:hypothetical protein
MSRCLVFGAQIGVQRQTIGYDTLTRCQLLHQACDTDWGQGNLVFWGVREMPGSKDITTYMHIHEIKYTCHVRGNPTLTSLFRIIFLKKVIDFLTLSIKPLTIARLFQTYLS